MLFALQLRKFSRKTEHLKNIYSQYKLRTPIENDDHKSQHRLKETQTQKTARNEADMRLKRFDIGYRSSHLERHRFRANFPHSKHSLKSVQFSPAARDLCSLSPRGGLPPLSAVLPPLLAGPSPTLGLPGPICRNPQL